MPNQKPKSLHHLKIESNRSICNCIAFQIKKKISPVYHSINVIKNAYLLNPWVQNYFLTFLMLYILLQISYYVMNNIFVNKTAPASPISFWDTYNKHCIITHFIMCCTLELWVNVTWIKKKKKYYHKTLTLNRE